MSAPRATIANAALRLNMRPSTAWLSVAISGLLGASVACAPLSSDPGDEDTALSDQDLAETKQEIELRWNLSGEVGLTDPGPFHQRYRRDEYSASQPFYQWWFFALRDLDAGRTFTFTYGVLDASRDDSQDNVGLGFSMTREAEGTAFNRRDERPLDLLQVRGTHDLTVDANDDGVPELRLEVIDRDTYRIQGAMLTPPDRSHLSGQYLGARPAEDIEVRWDLTLHRIHGWYGQNLLEPVLRRVHAISWNPYSHDAEVEGTVTVAGVTYTFERSPRYRAYGDGNWGGSFPSGLGDEDPIDYPWGWYNVIRPSAEPADDLSMIVGWGRNHFSNVTGITEAAFGDFRLGGDAQITAAQTELRKRAPDRRGFPIQGTNDGRLIQMRVDRGEWVDWIDENGTAQIPLRQLVTVETTSSLIQLDFHSSLSQYNRLVFPFEDYNFSDFEALGVPVHVLVERDGKVVEDFWSDAGGLEYGYRAPFDSVP